MKTQNTPPLSKLYMPIQRYGYLFIYVLWFTFEIILGYSTVATATDVGHDVYVYTERYLKFALMAYIVFFQRYSWKELLFIIPVSCLIYYSARLASSHELFYTWLFIVGAKNTSFDRIAKTTLIMLAVYIPLLSVLCFTGTIPDAGVFRGSDYRPAFGFTHPNFYSTRIFILLGCWFYLRQGKLHAADYIVSGILAVFIWIVPNSRTCTLCIILLMGLSILCSQFKAGKFKKLRKIYVSFLAAAAGAVNIGSVILTLLYSPDNALLRFADRLVSCRLSIANGLYKEFGLSALGQRIYVTMSERIFAGLGDKAVVFDNSYMRILLHWGIVIYILVSVFIIISLVYESQREDLMLFTVFAVILLYSFPEKILYQGLYCVFIIAASDLLYRKITPIKNADLS